MRNAKKKKRGRMCVCMCVPKAEKRRGTRVISLESTDDEMWQRKKGGVHVWQAPWATVFPFTFRLFAGIVVWECEPVSKMCLQVTELYFSWCALVLKAPAFHRCFVEQWGRERERNRTLVFLVSACSIQWYGVQQLWLSPYKSSSLLSLFFFFYLYCLEDKLRVIVANAAEHKDKEQKHRKKKKTNTLRHIFSGEERIDSTGPIK